jgi:protoporphyrinogen oxidase
MKDIVILGAGISGLSAGLKLSPDSNLCLLEKESFIGGLCASFTHNDCILDYGPHKLYSQLPGIMEEFSRILGEDCLSVKKKNSLRFMGKCFEFPMKITQLIKNISPKTVANGIGIGLGYSFTLLSNIIKKKENIT